MTAKRPIVFIKDTAATAKRDATREIYTSLLTLLTERGLQDAIQVVRVADIGVYDKGVVAKVLPEGTMYANLTAADLPDLVDAVLGARDLGRLRLESDPNKQVRLVLARCGSINPESIDDYLATGGYEGLRKALTMTPEQVIAELKVAGLRGRGGAGFPTWLKWQLTAQQPATPRYVICNGDEGDPGAYMDRSILEGDPHAVLEGMLIGGYAMGAAHGILYIRAEYPLAVRRIEHAIAQARERGFVGEKILGHPFSFDFEVRLGAGAFVCGEETSLIASVEGKRGTPRPRPPFPSVKGLWGKPTTINNVETWANVPFILQRGGAAFAAVGTAKSPGTKVFAITGKVRNSGLIEVPMGIALRDIVYDIGGGVASGKPLKAVQTGGPSGGVIPAKHLDSPVDYENLGKLGSIMGSGGLIVMDEDDCMVDIAKFYLQFCVDESCGKCAPCRIGTYQLLHYYTKISEGRGELADLDRIRSIGIAMQKASLCGLGQSAANPALSTLRYFEEEYREHIVNRRCPARKCKALVTYTILPDACKRCSLCFKNCPVKAISGDRTVGYTINQERCIKCGVCYNVCKFGAVKGA